MAALKVVAAAPTSFLVLLAVAVVVGLHCVPAAAAAKVPVPVPVPAVSPAVAPAAPPAAANVTKILSRYREFSVFSAMLAETGLARAISARPVVTVLAINNSAIPAAVRRLPRAFLADFLSLHVVLDYLDPERIDALRRGRTGNGSVVETMLQGTRARFLRIAGTEDGRVTFSYAGPGGGGSRNATLVRVVTAQAYRVLVLQVNGLILPAAVPATTAAPFNVTTILSPYPEFIIFNSLLTETGLAPTINARKVVTLLAVNNTAISRELHGLTRLPRKLVTDILALHAVVDFLDPEKLDALKRGRTGNGSVVTTLLHEGGGNPPARGAGFVRVSAGAGGRITFSSAAPGGLRNATLVRVVTAQANTVMILEVSGLILTPGTIKPQQPARHMSLPPTLAPAPTPRYPPASGPGLLAPSPMLPVPSAPDVTTAPPPAGGIIPIPSVHGGVAAKVPAPTAAAGHRAASWPRYAGVALQIMASLLLLVRL